MPGPVRAGPRGRSGIVLAGPDIPSWHHPVVSKIGVASRRPGPGLRQRTRTHGLSRTHELSRDPRQAPRRHDPGAPRQVGAPTRPHRRPSPAAGRLELLGLLDSGHKRSSREVVGLGADSTVVAFTFVPIGPVVEQRARPSPGPRAEATIRYRDVAIPSWYHSVVIVDAVATSGSFGRVIG